MTPIRVGIIGLRFGGQVLVPAFRADSRCQVTALAGRDIAKAGERARQLNVPKACADWQELVADREIDAVAAAVPPLLQPEIVCEAARRNKHVFCEKPLAVSVDEAGRAVAAVQQAKIAHGIDFLFPEIPAWLRAKELVTAGAIGRPMHFSYTWRVETYSSRTNADTWKASPAEGGGALGNFASHVCYNIEWMLGPVTAVHSFHRPAGAAADRRVDAVLELAENLSGVISIATDAFLGCGHVLELFGETGTLVLRNPGADYAHGFQLSLGLKAAGALAPVLVRSPDAGPDGRIAPVSRLASRFLDSIQDGRPMVPDLTHGLRVQRLLQRFHASTGDDAGF